MHLILLFLACSAGPDTPAAPLSEQASRGRSVYLQHCATCHQVDGAGLKGAFPPLAGSEWVSGEPRVLAKIVLNGLSGEISVAGSRYNSVMLAHRDTLTDAQIADVLTYIRADWGNRSAPVAAALVTGVREETAGRDGAWTAEELAR